MPERCKTFIVMLIVFALLAPACAGASGRPAAPSGDFKLMATTSILADVVRNIAGDRASVGVLLPPGADPHSFEPTPQDLVALSQADILFANGLGLETFLERVIQNAGEGVRFVQVSDGIEALQMVEEQHRGEHPEDEAVDPHVWMDPSNVMVWVDHIARALSELDPGNTATYQANATNYQEQLTTLDDWVREQTAQIPEDKRKLVSDHLVFGYYAQRYGFEQVGAAIQGFSSIAEPSAKEIASLENAIRALGVRAVFVSSSTNPALASRIAEDTQITVVQVYTGSLSDTSGPASTYIEMMRYNTLAIQGALK